MNLPKRLLHRDQSANAFHTPGGAFGETAISPYKSLSSTPVGNRETKDISRSLKYKPETTCTVPLSSDGHTTNG